MSSIDLTRSSLTKEDGLAQLSKYPTPKNRNSFDIFFFKGRSTENSKRIKSVQDKFVNSQVSCCFLLNISI